MTFDHVGDGNIHFNVVHNGHNTVFKEPYGQRIEHALCEVVLQLQGSISAEPGIGRKKQRLVNYSRNNDTIELMKST